MSGGKERMTEGWRQEMHWYRKIDTATSYESIRHQHEALLYCQLDRAVEEWTIDCETLACKLLLTL